MIQGSTIDVRPPIYAVDPDLGFNNTVQYSLLEDPINRE